jgi:RNA polymerase sigma factor (sigma-70 family)
MDLQPELVERARNGDRAALDELLRGAKDLVYNLAIRMLGSPADAEDATQEILLKIATHLDSFRGDSAFRTWAYRVASNHLLNTRKRGAAEQRVTSFDELEGRLAGNLAAGEPAVDDQLLVSEAKLICTTSMLACLDRDHRLAYILGEIFELANDEAAAIMEIGADAFRKRLSRARERMAQFMTRTCGLVDEANSCRCGKQAGHALAAGYLDAKCLVWSTHRTRERRQQSHARLADLDAMSRAIEVFRSHPEFIAADALVAGVRRALEAARSDLLQ